MPSHDDLRKVVAFKSIVSDELRSSGAAGAGLAVVSAAGFHWAGGVGLARRSDNQPVSADTVFHVASVSKTFIGLALVNLSLQGAFTLETPVQSLLPDVPLHNPWADAVPVTVRHLLEHTSGVQELVLPWHEDGRPTYLSALEALERFYPVVQPRLRPGLATTYANFNYTVASAIIEAVTGVPFDIYIRETTSSHWA